MVIPPHDLPALVRLRLTCLHNDNTAVPGPGRGPINNTDEGLRTVDGNEEEWSTISVMGPYACTRSVWSSPGPWTPRQVYPKVTNLLPEVTDVWWLLDWGQITKHEWTPNHQTTSSLKQQHVKTVHPTPKPCSSSAGSAAPGQPASEASSHNRMRD